jgi:toxin CcdB
MPQFEVFRNKSPTPKRHIPYLLDVQSDLFGGVATRVVVPLVRAKDFGLRTGRLNPSFRIEGIDVVMSTAQLAGVSRTVIGDKVGSLAGQRDEIVAALDFLFFGF